MTGAPGFPAAKRDERELTEPDTTRSFVGAHRVRQQIDFGESYDPCDVALAVETYRELCAYLLELGATAGSPA